MRTIKDDEDIYLEEEDLLDARIQIAYNHWKEYLREEYPEIVVPSENSEIENDNEFEEDATLLNAMVKKFDYYMVDDENREIKTATAYVEFKDRLTEVVDEYIVF